MNLFYKFFVVLLFVALQPLGQFCFCQTTFTPEDLLSIKRAYTSQLSPDGETLIWSVYTPRNANEKPGSAHREYFIMDLQTNKSTPLFDDKTKGGSPQFSPDGTLIAFTYKQEDGHTQVWAMPVGGGDKVQLTDADNNVSSYQWMPDGQGMVYLSLEPKTERELELEKRGYDFIFYEENLKNNRMFIIRFDKDLKPFSEQQIAEDTHVWDFELSPDGRWLAFSGSEKNLIDHRYMFRQIHIVDVASGEVVKKVGNKGKLGNYAFNEEGSLLAFSGALNMNDHAVSQAYTYSMADGTIKNHTPENFKGHISWVGWKDNETLLSYAGEGVYPTLSTININTNKRTVVLNAATQGVIFGTPLFTSNCKLFVFTGNTPEDPSNIYTWNGIGALKKITDLNPQLYDKTFGTQEVIRYHARDGKEIEGLLIKPVGFDQSKKYPLILYVHGGPEAHHNNGWLSYYSTPGQVMANKGYLVAYINYRASTGYGVDFAMEGFMDPAGKEFDDLADAIDYLIDKQHADKERVGMAGGSYGGYASAWFATYYTDKVKAVCMFVGISNVISKRGTTDIPWEEMYVHSGKLLEEQWQMNLERSPVYWAHQSKTATLIIGGADDTRVHPSQSMELYRRMKMNDHPAVRLVQYPGEGHGNRKQVGRIDVLYRQIEWFDWYVKDVKPIDGPMPPLDISDKYGLDWER